MKRPFILLLEHESGWLPLCQDDEAGVSVWSPAGQPSDAQPKRRLDVAEVIAHFQSAVRVESPRLIIGLASHRCFAGRVQTGGLPARQARSAAGYRFEPVVPFAVEELAIDTCGHGDDRLVVAARAEPLLVLVHGLEDAGVEVRGITPAALLAAQAIATEISPDPANRTVCLIEDAVGGTDACPPSRSELRLDDTGMPVCWHWHPGMDKPRGHTPTPITSADDTLRHALTMVRRIVEQGDTPWINLQQGLLASRQMVARIRRPLQACLLAAALLLGVVIGVMQARAAQYRGIASDYDARARAAYTEAFPGEKLPASMDRRLTTRLRELRGRQGLADPTLNLFSADNALTVMGDLLARLPGNTRLAVTDLRLSTGRIDLHGRARSHSEADTIAAALRADGLFEVAPPSTESLPTQGVQFSIHLIPRSGAGASRSSEGHDAEPAHVLSQAGPANTNGEAAR